MICLPTLKAAVAPSRPNLKPNSFLALRDRLESRINARVVPKLARPSNPSGTPNGWADGDETICSDSKIGDGGSGSLEDAPI